MKIEDENIFEVMRVILPEHRELMAKLDRESTRIEQPQLTEDQLHAVCVVRSVGRAARDSNHD